MGKYFRHLLLTAALLQAANLLQAQVNGCTDPLASNYNTSATLNDGSCSYNAVSYTPPVKVDPLTDSLTESSGLQWTGDALWSFNDRDNAAAIYRIDTAGNTLLQRVQLTGVKNTDWEDIAFDGTHLYIGDFGNNLTGARTDLVIYKIPLSDIPDYHTHPNVVIDSSRIERIHFRYSNQAIAPVDTAPNSTRFDCEAMLVYNGHIHLFSKNWVNYTTTHYMINSVTPGSYIASVADTLPINYLVTAADKLPGQDIVVLLGYQNTGLGSHALHVLSNFEGEHFFSGNKRRIDLPDATVMGQAEGICFTRGKNGFISNEKFVGTVGPFTITVPQRLRSFSLDGLVSNYPTTYTFTGDGAWSDSTNWQYGLVPPSTLLPGNEIKISPSGTCIADVIYKMPPGTKLTIAPGKNLLVTGNLIVQ